MPADPIPISLCPGPASAPRTKVPSGATDCHFHIFGTQDRYPRSAQTRYVFAEACVEAYLTMARTLGIERMVVVQPSPYGTDNRCTLDALRAFSLERARGVAVTGPEVSNARLQEMQASGIRGIRINAVTGGVPLSELDGLVSRIAPMGWHLQLFISHELLPRLEQTLRRLPLPVVIDHMGQVPASKGIKSAEFQCLLRLLEAKNIWVKLCGLLDRAFRSGQAWNIAYGHSPVALHHGSQTPSSCPRWPVSPHP